MLELLCIWRIKFHFLFDLLGCNPLQYNHRHQNCKAISFLIPTFSHHAMCFLLSVNIKQLVQQKQIQYYFLSSYCIISFQLRFIIFQESFCNKIDIMYRFCHTCNSNTTSDISRLYPFPYCISCGFCNFFIDILTLK